jgi:ABC-2 type transport system permease protein
MPSVLQSFAANQPVSQVADARRALLSGSAAGATVWHAVVWSLGITAVSMATAGGLFHRCVG